ncbi:MAG TPA: hypothetical protein VGF91_26580 [Solirubrobacteraceae bacterium]|jgi:hypothetical protein
MSALVVAAQLSQVEPESILQVSGVLETLLEESFDFFARRWSFLD